MKYVKTKTFTTNEYSLDETIQEAIDVVQISMNVLTGKNPDIEYALINLAEVEKYLTFIRRKVKIALNHVPKNIQEQEYL